MELKTAIEILEYHQKWRLGKCEDMIHEPKKLTEALGIVLSEVKKLAIQRHRQSEQFCECDAPFIRTSNNGGEYCAMCERDLD